MTSFMYTKNFVRKRIITVITIYKTDSRQQTHRQKTSPRRLRCEQFKENKFFRQRVYYAVHDPRKNLV